MKLRRLELRPIEIPFRVPFEHASARRDRTEAVLVEAGTTSGATGFGEGCPRSYVTGETLESARAFFDAQCAAVIESIGDMDDLIGWIRAHRAAIDANPAAWCAIELALLDALGRETGVPVDVLLGRPAGGGPFYYSAVVGDASPERFTSLVTLYRSQGFRDFKVKLSGRLERDRQKMECLAAEPDLCVRADANNLWTIPDEAVDYLDALGPRLFAVEEPLRPGDLDGLGEVAERTGLRIILDESLRTAAPIDDLALNPDRWILNLRVSKLGGLIRSFDVLHAARAAGLDVVVGAQVGETSLLTRSALSLAGAAGPHLIAQEGAFGTHLLQWDVCSPALMFGRGGMLLAAPPGPGLGLDLVPTGTPGLKPPMPARPTRGAPEARLE